MKSMTCKQLGGACNKMFQAETFEQISELSKEHGQEMFKKGDKAHVDAMNDMQQLMKYPDRMQAWMLQKRKEFEQLPDTK